MRKYEIEFIDPAEPDNNNSGTISEKRAKEIFKKPIIALITEKNFHSVQIITDAPSRLRITLLEETLPEDRGTVEKVVIGPPSQPKDRSERSENKTNPKPVVKEVKKPELNNQFTVIQGLGAKIQEELFKAGIDTFAKLARATKKQVRDVLEKCGPRFKNQDPFPLIQQAKYIRAAKWDLLATYQRQLSKGRRKPGPKPGAKKST